jgi:hypothetical protein
MARPRKRVCLEDGFKLDLNRLVREHIVVSEAVTSRTIFWQRSRDLVGVAVITADLTNWACPIVRIRMRNLDQTIDLIAQRRHLGGFQLYFRCCILGLRSSVLWMPPGATRFCSRQAWGKEIAYRTQFVGRTERARIGRERARSRLGGDKDADNRLLPPSKPKWMRWQTYERHIDRYSRCDAVVLKDDAVCTAKFSAQLSAK